MLGTFRIALFDVYFISLQSRPMLPTRVYNIDEAQAQNYQRKSAHLPISVGSHRKEGCPCWDVAHAQDLLT
eukprot:scaffold110909_cov12-Tisochrysis_lutea.AAC.1